MKPPSGHQQVILGQLINWYNGNKTFGVLHGIAGSGKTFVVQHLFGQLGSSVRPLLLAETNEAVNVLNRSTDYKFDCKKTYHKKDGESTTETRVTRGTFNKHGWLDWVTDFLVN